MTLILATVDGDPGIDFPQRIRRQQIQPLPAGPADNYRRVVDAVLGVFDAGGLRGHTTWFINERDIEWSANFPDVLRNLVACGDTVGLHVHHHGLFGSPPLGEGTDLLKALDTAKRRLEEVTECVCRCYRGGCYYQAACVYEALARLDVCVISDVFPGFHGRTKEDFLLDNTAVPLTAEPWRHDAGNWMDYASRMGRFLHIPVLGGGLGGLNTFIETVKRHRLHVACFGFHPHEFQADDGGISPSALARLKTALNRMAAECSARFVNFDEVQAVIASPTNGSLKTGT